MIKEKTIYCSTVTGEDYTSLEDAVRAEKEDESVCNLMGEFHKVMCDYKNEIEKVNALYERMDKIVKQKLENLHDKFDPTLNLLTKQLNDLGFDVAEITAGKCLTNAKRVKVRVVKKKLI